MLIWGPDGVSEFYSEQGMLNLQGEAGTKSKLAIGHFYTDKLASILAITFSICLDYIVVHLLFLINLILHLNVIKVSFSGYFLFFPEMLKIKLLFYGITDDAFAVNFQLPSNLDKCRFGMSTYSFRLLYTFSFVKSLFNFCIFNLAPPELNDYTCIFSYM